MAPAALCPAAGPLGSDFPSLAPSRKPVATTNMPTRVQVVTNAPTLLSMSMPFSMSMSMPVPMSMSMPVSLSMSLSMAMPSFMYEFGQQGRKKSPKGGLKKAKGKEKVSRRFKTSPYRLPMHFNHALTFLIVLFFNLIRTSKGPKGVVTQET